MAKSKAAKGLVKLLSIASEPLGPALPESIPALLSKEGERGEELWELLQRKNGFYAFESALHLLPLGGPGDQTLERWNEGSLWRDAYQDLAEGCFFFAEDLFGGQFAFEDGVVCSFDPETGEREELAETLAQWAEAVLADYQTLTAQPLAHQWQAAHGTLAKGRRLLPKVPFVAGGEFALENLYAAHAVKAMRARAALALQVRDLPDGSEINFEVVE